LSAWQPGVSLELGAFSDYVEGRPKIDTITFRFFGDPPTLLASVLSGDVEAALPDGLSVEMARDLQEGWAAPGTGNNVVLSYDGRLFRLYFQHRPEYAKPSAARDPRVRHAFYHTLDKNGINEVELDGLGRPAESWVPPEDARFSRFRDAVPDWSYDLSLAQRLLQEAGWERGADGLLVHAATGQRMETEIRVTPGQGHVKAVAVMANGWRQVGALPTETVIPANLVTDLQYRATAPFTGMYGHAIGLDWEDRFYSCGQVATAENRWLGSQGGYCNPAVQPLIDRLQITIPDADRTSLQAQIMRTVLKDDLAEAPLYWQVTPYVFAKGVTELGDLRGWGNALVNAHHWDKLS
jgi:peptide/nickel transport system substrate-binding protein